MGQFVKPMCCACANWTFYYYYQYNFRFVFHRSFFKCHFNYCWIVGMCKFLNLYMKCVLRYFTVIQCFINLFCQIIVKCFFFLKKPSNLNSNTLIHVIWTKIAVESHVMYVTIFSEYIKYIYTILYFLW